MLVYQFMSAAYGLDDLRKRRLKVSFLADMNDPFELLGTILDHAEHRQAFHRWRNDMDRISRVLCFSQSWSNPVLWSHYADKHRGVCLGFEVPDQCLLPVSYVASPLELKLQLEKQLLDHGTVGDEIVRKLLTTKFDDWEYEDEVRMFVRPSETYEELGLHFYRFGPELVLKKVVIGPRSTGITKEINAAIQPQDGKVEVIATSLAFNSFRVIPAPI